MRYKVPQNIDMEDRIVGPLTMTQFVYLLVGGMLIYLAWLLLTPTSFWFVAIPVGFTSLCFAFLKVQDQPLPKFLGAALLYALRPKSRVWQKEEMVEHLKIVSKQPSQPEEQSPEQVGPSASELEELAARLDLGGIGPNGQSPTSPAPARAVAQKTSADKAAAIASLPPQPDGPAATVVPVAATPPGSEANEDPNSAQLASIRELAGQNGASAQPPPHQGTTNG